ncbi:unnamed protein product [Pleuronectes platessa]|uniref:Uncharacterized protein n=1 Tax=Pleuronectes platessa TaxID=8262 RepID=A0A9N7VBZ1_PLEPL|nr:unnamed protein product [Pleuronectes platessa]
MKGPGRPTLNLPGPQLNDYAAPGPVMNSDQAELLCVSFTVSQEGKNSRSGHRPAWILQRSGPKAGIQESTNLFGTSRLPDRWRIITQDRLTGSGIHSQTRPRFARTSDPDWSFNFNLVTSRSFLHNRAWYVYF